MSERQLERGDLLWILGDADQSDDIAVQVSDPFGSAPTSSIHLLGDPSDASLTLISPGDYPPELLSPPHDG